MALKGLRRKKPRAGDTRLPITPWVLTTIGQSLTVQCEPYDQAMLWAACTVGFFALMRSGELTVPGGVTFDPSRHLTPRDVAIDDHNNPSAMRIHLKVSKTDYTHQGVNIYIGRTHNHLCPVVAMLKYLAIRGFDNGPLFRWRDGTPLQRPVFVAKLRGILAAAGIEATGYSGHSFRIGAATTAAANGVNEATIQQMGRWKSDSYCRYIRPPIQTLVNLSQVLSS
jgi:hypothetical protein